MGSIKNAFNFILHPTSSRTTGILIILVIAAVVPLTVFVAQKQQELRQRAEESSVCSDTAIELCSPSVFYFSSSCNQEGKKCKDNNGTIYICQKQ
ncbi:MAG: hypothetical protein AAB662_03395 [Patescibacteria group bacterium]